jgi:hypothetical protein
LLLAKLNTSPKFFRPCSNSNTTTFFRMDELGYRLLIARPR